MSSNFPHYAPLGSSVPNDYAIVAHFASGHDDSALESDAEDILEDGEPRISPSSSPRLGRMVRRAPSGELAYRNGGGYGTTSTSPSRGRRLSVPHAGRGPRKPSFGNLSSKSPVPEEHQPLLAGVGRIDEGDARPEEHETWHLWLQELKIVSKYTLPVFGTHLLEYSLSMASVISIGHLSTTHLAAVTLGSMTSSVTGLSVLLGFVSALDSLLPHAWTSNPSLVGLWSQRMLFLMGLLLIPILCIWFNAEPVLLLLRQEPEVAHLAGVYLKWLSIGLPAYAFNAVSRRFFQSIGLLHVPTYIVIFVAPINVLLNYLLVWGPESIRLGYKGAPISTAISFNLIAILTLIYGIMYAPREALAPFSRATFKSLGVLVQLGMAGVGQLAAEWWSWELVGLAASLLGPVSLASQSVLLVSASTSYQAPFALSVAASVRIGNHLGSGHALKAKVATSVALCMSLVLGLFFSAVFTIFRHKWAYIFNDDIEVVLLVAKILPLVGMFQILDGLCAVTAGILRSRGRQSLGALLNFVCYYVIGIPLGLMLTFKFDMALYGLWIGLAVALLVGAAVSVTIVLRTDWEHEIDRVQARLAGEDGGDVDNVKVPRIVEREDV